MSDLITMNSSVLPASARVIGFRGDEAISRPYRFEVFISVDDSEELDINDAIGAKAALIIDRADDRLPPFSFAGIVASLELMHAHGGRSLFRVVLLPRLWLLGLSKHSRIFTRMRLPDIITSILQENGIGADDYELRLGSYDTEEHICQYRESDLDFLSRWMEREGIFYFFEHTDEGEKLILCDSRTYNPDPLGTAVRYFPQLGHDVSAGASFRTFTYQKTTLPAMVRLRDYDYARPNLALSSSSRVAADGAGEVNLYGERFFSPSSGDKLARVRSEELKTQEVIARGTGTRLHLRTGYVFEIEEHPRPELNTSYLATEIHHEGNQAAAHPHFRELIGVQHEDVYHAITSAIPATTQFRAESRTPWPRIYGYENGNVDGEADSEYAQIDDQGRYKVKLKFDEGTFSGGKASTFVRMMQPHGGSIEGFHFPLRKGTEVALSFLGGDPDRPVISGVVPNTYTPSPVTSGNHTKNVIQTGGRNRLELEDKANEQRITLSTPYSNTYLRMGSPNDEHELIVHTDDNALVDAHVNFDITVGQGGSGNMTTTVKNDSTTTIQLGNMTTTVATGNMTTTVSTGSSLHEVQQKVTEIYHGGQSTEVTGTKWLTTSDQFQTFVRGLHLIESDQEFRHQVKGGLNLHVIDGGQHDTIDAGGWTAAVTAGGIDISSAGGDISITAPSNNITIESVNSSVSSTGNWFEQHSGDWVKIDWSKGLEFNLTTTASFTLGATFDMFVGLQASVFRGVKLEFSESLSLSASIAASIEMNAGISATLNASIGLEWEAVGLEQITNDLKLKAIDLNIHGFTLVL